MSRDCTIRVATAADAPAIAPLLGQLGYPASVEETAARVTSLRSSQADYVVVAQLDGAVVGVATAHAFLAIHTTDPVVWIASLVVDPSVRRRGVGAELVAALEAWATDVGAPRVSVTSANRRDDAHGFYLSLGYEQTGLRFTKRLG